MEIGLINPYTVKILIASRAKDSINAISNRISLSYGWCYKWVKDLAKLGVFRLTRMNVYINKNNEFYKSTLRYIKETFGSDISFYYEVLDLFGIKYCFTKTDGVFVWTKGGYNISRFKEFYPIFIKVAKKDRETFESYCTKLGLKINRQGKIFYHVDYLDDFEFVYFNDKPVDLLEDTISFMRKNIYNFEPALEMIEEIHKKRLGIKYKEATTNV